MEADVSSLNRTMQYGNIFKGFLRFRLKEFKSYYVVWKQDRRGGRIMFYSGLNRTMQYGNFFECSRSDLLLFRLNRTMQYGNKNI